LRGMNDVMLRARSQVLELALSMDVDRYC